MLYVKGQLLHINEVRPKDDIEEVILYRLHEDPTNHSYSSLRELQVELTLRKHIILSARALNFSRAQFADFRDAFCNPRYWQLTKEGGFLQRSDVSSSDAIEDIFVNSYSYAFECATAIMILFYHAILNTIGRDAFHFHFQRLLLYSWHHDDDLGMTTENVSHFIPGDVVYFNNPDVNPAQLHWRGENAVLLEDNTYYGHGVSIQTKEEMIAILNEERIPGSTQSAYLMDFATRLSARQITSLQTPKRKPQRRERLIPHREPSISSKQYAVLKLHNRRNF